MPDDIRASGQRYGLDLSYEERAGLERGASTSKILNEAAKKSGSDHVDVTGDDMTYGEVVHEQKTKADWIEIAGLAIEGGCKLTELAEAFADGAHAGHSVAVAAETVEGFAKLGGLAGAASVAELIGMGVGPAMAGKELYTAWIEHDERREATAKEAMHVALNANLQLPAGFKAEELAKRPDVVGGWHASAEKLAEVISQRPDMMRVLQLRCDEGMRSAEEMLRSGSSQADYLKAHSGLEQRFHKDAAFRAGFDAMVWAKEKGPAELDAAVKELHSRDARFHTDRNQVWAA